MSQQMVGRPGNAIMLRWKRMKCKVEEYIRNKNIDGVNRIKDDNGVYLIGDDTEGCLRAARQKDEKAAAKAAAKASKEGRPPKKGRPLAAKNYYDDDEHPYNIILDHLDERMELLKTKLSDDKKDETVKMLRGLAKNIIDSPMSLSTLNLYAERKIKEFVVTHLVDLNEERYKEKITDSARSGKCITLGEYVVDKIVASLKCGLRDILSNYDYQGKVQPDKVRELLNEIDVALEVNGFKNTAKGGSGPAKKRRKDYNMYPDKVYNQSVFMQLKIKVSREERAQLERIAIIYLVLTTGNCSNLQLVVEDNPFDGGVYIMFSKFETIADHFTAFGRQERGIILPEGTKMVVDTPTGTIDSNNTETEAAAPTAAAGGGGVDENSSTEEDTEETSDLVDNVEIVNTETTPAAPTAAGGVVDESSGAVAPDAEDDDCIDFGNNFTGYGEGEGEDDEKPPTFFGGTPSSSTSPYELSSNSLPSDNTRVVTPTNVPDNLSRAMERKLASESRFYEANAAKVEEETRDLQRKYAIENLCDRSKRRFLEEHIHTSPERVRTLHKNGQLVDSLVSSLYTGTEVAPPKFSQDVNETLEQMFPNED